MSTSLHSQPSILVVDDTPANLRLLVQILSQKGYKVRPTTQGHLAIRAAKTTPPDLILLDINMPDLNGYEVCELLKQDEDLKDIPVIFISALNQTLDKVRAFEVGGVDYITKPFELEEVYMRVETHINLARQRRELERLRELDHEYFKKLTQMKDEFLATASHDLKNPLTSILMSLDLLRMQNFVTDERAIRILDRALNGVKRMQGLIGDILDLAKLETGRALEEETVDVHRFLNMVVDDMLLRAEHNDLTLTLTVDDNVRYAYIDPTLTYRCLENLISNAIKYTPSDGQAEVSARVENGHDLVIAVSDTGLGIPAEDLPNLFTKFHRVESDAHLAQEGTGLGLSIVESIIENHNGRIEVSSEEGVGSTFTLYFTGRIVAKGEANTVDEAS